MTDSPRREDSMVTPVEKLRHEFDRWLEAAWQQGGRAMETMGLRGRTTWTPPVDVFEDQERVRVLIDLPGVAAGEIDLTLSGNMLTVSGVLPVFEVGDRENRHVCERPIGAFRRSIPLPTGVDAKTITAESRHGVLIVTVAKSEREKGIKIPVQTPGASSGNMT